MERIIPVDNGAEALIELLNANGVKYIFLNPGTDTYCVQEALSKFKALGKQAPEAILCLHESVAMAAAHGYFMMTGKPQMVLVHADLGPQQVGGALHNAQRGRAGIVLSSGKVPVNIDQGRFNQVHWLQDQFDQSGVVRGYVKWEYTLNSTSGIHHIVQRAFQVASSEPAGPVYLCLSQDALSEKMKEVRIPDSAKYPCVSASIPDSSLLSEVASILLEAENPLIITSYCGKNPDSVSPLVELAEALGARVISSQFKMNFPNTHPLFNGFDASPHLKDSDAILIIDHDVPYVPSRIKPSPSAKIIHIDVDPLKENIPIWGFPADRLIRADSRVVLPALIQLIRQKMTGEQKVRVQSRTPKIQEEHQKMKEGWRNLAVAKSAQKPISPEWLCHCIGEAIGPEDVIVAEPVTNTATVLRQVDRMQPATYFQSGGSNLGWALGAAVGVKLANPEKTVVSIVGDGGFNFGCPTAALWAANAYHASFLCVIINNMRYNAPTLALQQNSGGASYSEKTGCWIGVDIKPSPDYAAIARACYAYGQMVEDPAEIQSALIKALEQVHQGKAAVLDVRVGLQ